MIKNITRMAGLILAFGLFFGCQRNVTTQATKLNLDQQDYSQALNSIENSLKANPNNPDAYFYKGSILEKMAVQQKEPVNRKPLYSEMRNAFVKAKKLYKAQSQTTSDNYQKIDNILSKSWAKEHNEGVSILKNDSTGNRQQFELSLQYLDNANVIEPDSGITYEVKAEDYYKLGDLTKAISTLETAVSLDNNSHIQRDIIRLAFLYLENQQYDHAIDTYKEALQNEPGDINLLHGLANAYLANGEHEKAADLLNHLLENDVNNSTYLLAYGIQLYSISQSYFEELYQIRKNIYQQATHQKQSSDDSSLTALSDSVDSIENKAKSYFEHAEKNLLKAKSVDSTNTNIDYALGSMYENTGTYYIKMMGVIRDKKLAELYDGTVHDLLRKAVTYLAIVAKKEPDNMNLLKSLYKTYMYLGIKDKATEIKKKINT